MHKKHYEASTCTHTYVAASKACQAQMKTDLGKMITNKKYNIHSYKYKVENAHKMCQDEILKAKNVCDAKAKASTGASALLIGVVTIGLTSTILF